MESEHPDDKRFLELLWLKYGVGVDVDAELHEMIEAHAADGEILRDLARRAGFPEPELARALAGVTSVDPDSPGEELRRYDGAPIVRVNVGTGEVTGGRPNPHGPPG